MSNVALNEVLEAAERHGDEEGRDREAADLAAMLCFAYGLLGPAQQEEFLRSAPVREVLEGGW